METEDGGREIKILIKYYLGVSSPRKAGVNTDGLKRESWWQEDEEVICDAAINHLAMIDYIPQTIRSRISNWIDLQMSRLA